MADKRTLVSAVQLKGPAGNVTTDVRLIATQVNLHGSTDKRIRVNQITLVAPPPDKHLSVSMVQLVGPASVSRSVYTRTDHGWVPVDIYLPVNGVWTKFA